MTYSPEEITNALNGADAEKIREVVQAVEQSATSGDARSNYMIAKWYEHGLFGFKKDKSKYDVHMNVALQRLLPEALYDYGVSKDGDSIEQSRKALGYYVLASVLGDTDAIDALIGYFTYGTVVERDDFIASSLRMISDRFKAGKPSE